MKVIETPIRGVFEVPEENINTFSQEFNKLLADNNIKFLGQFQVGKSFEYTEFEEISDE